MVWYIDEIKKLNDRAVKAGKITYANPEVHIEGDFDELAKQHGELAQAYDTLLQLCWEVYDSRGEDQDCAMDQFLAYMETLDASKGEDDVP